MIEMKQALGHDVPKAEMNRYLSVVENREERIENKMNDIKMRLVQWYN